jgi:hypothetical protein
MAVRDDEQARRPLPWRDTLGHAPAVLLLGGLLMYAYLSICYDRFYGSLGVDPNDVGFTYAGTLARSSGFVVTSLLIAAYLATAPLAVAQAARHRLLDPASPMSRRMLVSSRFIAVALLVAAALPWPMVKASNAARDVQAGRPVGPIQSLKNPWSSRPFLLIPVLAIRADPATVEPVGKPGDSPAAERLRGRRLLYLGQSGGTVVLYDAATQRAVYVPAGSIILHVTNCDAKPPPDPACGTAGR